jgi:septal ring factor EnvC (AmiA/AmiB activator)
MRTILISASVLLAGTLLSGSAAAQVERSGGGANAQLAMQYQQVVTERTQLQEENEKLKKDLGDLKKQLDGAEHQLTAAKAAEANRNQARLAAAQAARDSSAKDLEVAKGKMQELVDRYRETATTLRTVETDRAQVTQQLAASQAAFDKCAQDNVSISQITAEVLNRYEHQHLFSDLGRAEPFTKIKQTQVENLVLEYREAVDQLHVKPSSAPAAPSPTGR